jgi:hypothetical protein
MERLEAGQVVEVGQGPKPILLLRVATLIYLLVKNVYALVYGRYVTQE